MDAAVKNEVAQAIKAAEEGGLVKGVSQIMTVLQKHNLVREQILEPGVVGTHPENRDGFGISALDTHSLLQSISEIGFDERQCNAICVEVSSSTLDKAYSFNAELVRQSMGLLPPIPRGTLRYLSLSCSHTNAALRCLIAGSPSKSETLSLDGRLHLGRASSLDPMLGKACREGIKWKVVNSEVDLEFPSFSALVQASMNTSVSRGEHEAQMLLRIFKAQESAKDLGKPFTWDELRARLLKSKPACAACMPGMFKFLKKFGGGMLARTEAFIKSSAGSSRQLGPDFFEHLSLDPKPQTQNPCVMFRHALLVAGYTCPIDKFLNASDVKKLFAKDFMPDNIAANAMMGEIDSLIKATFPTEHPHKSEIDQLQVAFERNLVMVALQKKHKDLPDLADLNECAIALCSGIEKATGGTVLSTKWKASEASSASCTTAKAAPAPPCLCSVH